LASPQDSFERLLYEIANDRYLFSILNYVPSAWTGHAPFLKFLIRELKPAVFVELGVHNGFSYFVGCQSIQECNLSTKAFGIDHWAGDSQAGFFDASIYQTVKLINKKYESFSTLIKKTFNEAKANFENSTVDLLHIDGFHSYESVKEDFESWLPKMSNHGIVLFHDIHVRRESFEVYKFWGELKSKYKTMEFTGAHGLGVLFLGDIPKGKIMEIFDSGKEGNFSQIQGTFGSVSDDVIQHSAQKLIQSLIAERDIALLDRENILNSSIWRVSKPIRWLRNKF
jgi:predicted O-methyltransferase YrrM